MINGIQNVLANPTFYNITQGTATQMGIKTGLNSVARPGFILMDGNIDPHTKKFSATKEFLYQAISLAMYLGIIIPVFKKGAYKAAQKYFKDSAVLKAFNSPEEFKAFQKLTEEDKVKKLAELSQKVLNSPKEFKVFKKLTPEKLTEEMTKLKEKSGSGDVFTRKNIDKDSEDLANGVIETSSLLGTIIGLAIIAPLTATKIVHPIMKAIGMDKGAEEAIDKHQEKLENDDHDDDDDDKVHEHDD